MKIHIKSLFVIFLLFTASCGRPAIDEHKVIGAWQLSARNKTVVYTFHDDHTYTIGSPGRPDIPWGHWRLDGNQLIQDAGLLAAVPTNADTTSKLARERDTVANMTTTVMITSISDSEMVWRGDTSLIGVSLKKVSH
jgi:hypothetical protein